MYKRLPGYQRVILWLSHNFDHGIFSKMVISYSYLSPFVVDSPMQNGDFSIKHDGFPIKNCDFPIEIGCFFPFKIVIFPLKFVISP